MKRVMMAMAVGLLSAGAFADIASPVERSFTVAPGGKLLVDTDLGTIDVRAVPADKVSVRVERVVKTNDKDKADELLERFELRMNQNGPNVTIRGDYDREDSFLGFLKDPQLRVKYIIQVPTRYNVNLQTAGGHITVNGLTGSVIAETAGGHLEFGTIDGPVNGQTSGGHITLHKSRGKAVLETSGGHITIGEVDGPVDAETSGGSIRIARARGNVRAETSGGSIRVDEIYGAVDASTSGGSIEARLSSQPKGNSRLETSGGTVVVYLLPTVGLELDAETSGGKVLTALPVQVRGELEKGSLRGALNGGGPRLVLRSSGGDIRVEKFAKK